MKNNTIRLENKDNNTLSLAFKIEFGNQKIILTGDATQPNWYDRERIHSKYIGDIDANIAKLSHHGSKKDNNKKIFDYIFGTKKSNKPICAISANGKSHPDVEVLENLQESNISPHCTNISEHCFDLENFDFDKAKSEISDDLKKQLLQAGVFNKSFPCKGNICFSISDLGKVKVTSQLKGFFCPYKNYI